MGKMFWMFFFWVRDYLEKLLILWTDSNMAGDLMRVWNPMSDGGLLLIGLKGRQTSVL